MWGRQHDAVRHLLGHRNTPTLVGKTTRKPETRISTSKHPHARGEDATCLYSSKEELETPPRTWEKNLQVEINFGLFGNTPTHVGKTIWF